MHVTEESPKRTPRARRMTGYDIAMQRIRTHCEQMEANGITLEKLIALRDQKRQLATLSQEGGQA